MRLSLTSVLFTACLAACAVDAHAQVAHSTAAERQAAAAAAASQQAGSLTPAPGQPQPPTAEELAALAAVARMTSRDSSNLKVVHHPDGQISVNLEGTFLNIASATVGADGALAFTCAIPGHDHGKTAGAASPAPAAKLLEVK